MNIQEEHDRVIRRALAAFYSEPVEPGTAEGAEHAAPERSTVEQLAKLDYVILRNSRKTILAVYRIRNDGKLKRLVRLPPDLSVRGSTSLDEEVVWSQIDSTIIAIAAEKGTGLAKAVDAQLKRMPGATRLDGTVALLNASLEHARVKDVDFGATPAKKATAKKAKR